ncbi:MAG: tripartite tricarboxylate transporter substrate binding protein [Betaproteobacteria bacterium]|nr:tripartite tricarboxylate transporter substrate binding protein [Betaproteobacteria bacterium]
MSTKRFSPFTTHQSLITLFLLALAAGTASAQQYPAKPVRVITGFAGGSDLMARMVAQLLSPELGQQVYVEQRLGAAGSIGFEAAARAPADGYTLLLGAITLVTNPFILPRVGYDPVKSFAPVMLLSTIPNGLFVHPSVPVKSLRELVALARNSPGKIAYGSGGVGSANHLAAESLQSIAKIKFTHVPYKSATLGLVGAMSGDVDMVITVVSSGAAYVKDGRMRGLAVLDAKRSAAMPAVPTAAEAGVPGLVAVNWYALLAPAGTPRAIVERLYAATAKVMSPADVQSRLRATGGEPQSMTPDQTAEFIRSEYARWEKVIREAGVKNK